jgi:hypothetical protein
MVRTKHTNDVVMQAACNDITVEVATTDLQQEVRLLELEQKELECSFTERSMFEKKGVILQFLNNNCTGATSLIGGIRLALDDIRKVPAYLDRHANRIKHYAVVCLDRHIKANQCPIGAGEYLAQEDYGISFSLATTSPQGAAMHPAKRQEGQLFHCLFPGLNQPIHLGVNPDGTDDYAHMVNVFIHLLPAGQRRTHLLRRMDRGELTPPTGLTPIDIPSKRLKDSAYSSPNNSGHGSGSGRSPSTFRKSQTPVHDSPAKFQKRLEAMERDLNCVKGMQLPTPPLPITAPPVWRRDGVPTLPDGL